MSGKIRAKDIPANFDGYRKNKRRRVDTVSRNITRLNLVKSAIFQK